MVNWIRERSILRNYSVLSTRLAGGSAKKAESCRELYKQRVSKAGRRRGLLDDMASAKGGPFRCCLARSELFPLEFWLHLWGNAKGVLKKVDIILPICEALGI